jgi:hypothetical protein
VSESFESDAEGGAREMEESPEFKMPEAPYRKSLATRSEEEDEDDEDEEGEDEGDEQEDSEKVAQTNKNESASFRFVCKLLILTDSRA